jgi:hypothetical protein
VVECDEWPAQIASLIRANTNPCKKSGDAFRLSICANSADTNYGIKRPTANLPHAMVATENA